MRILLSVALLAGVAAAEPVTFSEPETTAHPHLRSFKTRTVEGGREAFSERSDLDAEGRLAKRISYKAGQRVGTVEYTWDSGRLVKRVSTDDTGEASTRTYVYTLDKMSRIESVLVNGTSKETYRWDAKGGREVTTTHPDGKGNDVFDAAITYDASGRVVKRCTSTGMVTQAVKPTTVCQIFELDKQGHVKRESTKPARKYFPAIAYANSYDKEGRLVKVVPSNKELGTRTFTWNANGDVATVTDSDGMVTTYTYEPR